MGVPYPDLLFLESAKLEFDSVRHGYLHLAPNHAMIENSAQVGNRFDIFLKVKWMSWFELEGRTYKDKS